MGSGILGSGSSKLFEGSDRFPSLSSSSRARRLEEEALAWAAIERLPTYQRLRTSILNDLIVDNQSIGSPLNQIDVTKIPAEVRKQFIERLLGVLEQDNERFMLKVRQRLDGYLTPSTLFWNLLQFFLPSIFVFLLCHHFCLCQSEWELSYRRLRSVFRI